MSRILDIQWLFIREYLKDLNGAQAAIRAGYAESNARITAHRLLKKPQIVAEIDKLKAERAARLEIDTDWVVAKIVETVKRCSQEVKPIVDNKGQPVLVEDKDGDLKQAYTFDARGVLQGTDQLMKHLGGYPNKVEVTGKDGQPLTATPPPAVNVIFTSPDEADKG